MGGALTLDHLIDAEGKALQADVNPDSLVWVMQPREFTKLRKVKNGAQRYQLQPDPTRPRRARTSCSVTA